MTEEGKWTEQGKGLKVSGEGAGTSSCWLGVGLSYVNPDKCQI